MAGDWSRSETISTPDEIVIEYSITGQQGPEKKEVVLISTPRSINTVYHRPVSYTDAEGKQQTREIITSKIDEKRTTVAAVNPAFIVWRLGQGLGLPLGDVINVTETTYEYVITTDGPKLIRDQVSDYITEWQLAGSLAIEKYNNYTPTADRFESSRTVTLYDEWNGPDGRAITRRRISRWNAMGLAQEGSQAVQRKLKSIKAFLNAAQDLTGANLKAVVDSAKKLIFEGTEMQIETGRIPIPEMPTAADRVADEIVNGSDTTDIDGNGIPDWAQYDPADPFDVDSNGDGISDWVDLESLYEPEDNERRTNNDFIFDDQLSLQAVDFDPATGLPIDPVTGNPVKAVTDFQVDNLGRLIDPTTGQPYSPPITVTLDPVTGRPADTGMGLLINPTTGQPYNPPRFTRVDPDSKQPIFAGDSVTATYEMPFSPDDTIEFVDGVRTVVPGGSEDAAELFGEVEAALDYGHAYGQNIVAAFGEMPSLALAPIYVQLAGVEGAFLMDSVTYAWGAEGMVVSSDLMLLGVTGRYGDTVPSASWLRAPVPVAQLQQINAAGTVEANPQKANTIAIPGGFDARNPAATLAALPTNGTDVFREWRNGNQLVQPVVKVKRKGLFTKPVLKVREFPYSLTPASETVVLMSQPTIEFVWMVGTSPPAASVAITALAPSIRIGASVRPPAAAIGVVGQVPIVSRSAVVTVPPAAIAVTALAPEQVGRPRIEISVPTAAVAIAAAAPIISREVVVNVPVAPIAVAGVAPAVQTAPADPNFSNVSLLLHMNGSNNSTTFTDSSSLGLSVSAFGNAKISTAQSRFGGASCLFDGNGDYLLATSSGFSFGNGDFTIEGWIYVVNGSNYHAIASLISNSDNNSLYVWQNRLMWWDNGAMITSGSFSLNTWHHFAVTRASNLIRVFLNGVKASTDHASPANIASGSVRIGTRGAANDEWFNGYIDELRITKGVARYTANFTPPTAPFPDS